MDEIIDSLDNINSDRPGRRYFNSKKSSETPLNYGQLISDVGEEELLPIFKKGDSMYGASIKQVSKIELAEFVRSSKKSPINRLLSDSGMHLVNPEEL